MIEYKGYIGAVDFDPEIDLFHGTVINTNDVITFYGSSVSELREEMQKSIEGYLEFCTEQGITPEKPFSGEFTIQMSPEMHCRLALNAERLNLDFNVYLQEVLEKAVFSLEKYLLKSNVVSGKAERNAQIALEEKEKMDTSKPSPIPKQPVALSEGRGGWTVTRVRDLVPREFREHHESKHTCKEFYRWIADSLNLVEEKGWELEPRFRKHYFNLYSKDKPGHKGRRVFGLRLNGFNPVRFYVIITREEGEKLSNQYGCKMVSYTKTQAHYIVRRDVKELLPVFEFAYNKHRRK